VTCAAQYIQGVELLVSLRTAQIKNDAASFERALEAIQAYSITVGSNNSSTRVDCRSARR
jgi:hypothetical protein